MPGQSLPTPDRLAQARVNLSAVGRNPFAVSIQILDLYGEVKRFVHRGLSKTLSGRLLEYLRRRNHRKKRDRMMDVFGDEKDPKQDGRSRELHYTYKRAVMAEPKIRIRYATPSDLADVSALFRDVISGLQFYNEPSRQMELVRFCEPALGTILAKDSKAIAVATVHPSKTIVGFCIAVNQPGEIWMDADKIWIEWLGTEIRSRRNKIGHALIEHLIADAQSRGATKISCITRPNNRPSNALLEKAGFRRLRTLKNHWHKQDICEWERKICRRPPDDGAD